MGNGSGNGFMLWTQYPRGLGNGSKVWTHLRVLAKSTSAHVDWTWSSIGEAKQTQSRVHVYVGCLARWDRCCGQGVCGTGPGIRPDQECLQENPSSLWYSVTPRRRARLLMYEKAMYMKTERSHGGYKRCIGGQGIYIWIHIGLFLYILLNWSVK
jgi:hypothetical protein